VPTHGLKTRSFPAPIPVDRQRQQRHWRDQIGNQNGEGQPREIVEQLGQLGARFRAESAEHSQKCWAMRNRVGGPPAQAIRL